MFGFNKDLNVVIAGLSKTLDDLQLVAEQQSVLADEQDTIIAAASVKRQEADNTGARATRIAIKVADLLS
jgi:hypothetical protein